MTFDGLWLCGPTGVGKSTVGYEIFASIHRSGRKAAYVDADQVGMCYPAPGDDPYNHRVKAANVAAVWRGFRAAGAECLIVSGGVRSGADLQLYREQLADISLLVCRLRVEEDELRGRLKVRASGFGPPVPGRQAWRTDRSESVGNAIADFVLLETATFAELVVDITRLTPAEAAARVRQLADGWPIS